MSELSEWLLQILKEDSDPSEIPHSIACNSLMGGEAGWGLRKCDCEIPARWLADITAKRAIVEVLAWERERQRVATDDMVVRVLATAYADRRGYRQEWWPQEWKSFATPDSAGK